MAYEQQTFTSHNLEGTSLRSECQNLYWVGQNLYWVADCHLLAVSSHGGRGDLGHWGLFYQSTNPIQEGPTHALIIPVAPSSTITLWVTISMYEFGVCVWDTNIQTA